MWGAIAASIGKGLPKRTWGHHDKKRRPRRISSGPKRGKPTRRVTDPTSRAAIRRSEERRGIRTTGPKPPTSRGPKRPSRTINTGPKRPKRTTSQAAIARFKAMRGRRRR